MSNNKKYFLFQNPTQLLIQGQWWSMLSTHLLQAEQWWHLSGLKTLHIKQYLLLLFSGSPRWNPQKTGTCPGSVVILWKNAHMSSTNKRWKNASNIITRMLSIVRVCMNVKVVLTDSSWAPYHENISIVEQRDDHQHEQNKQVTDEFCRSHWQSSRHIWRI